MRPLFILLLSILISTSSLADKVFFGDKLIKIDLSDYDANKINSETDRFHLSAFGIKDKTSFSITISMDSFADSQTCRQIQWAKIAKKGEPRNNIREYELAPYSITEWTAPPINNITPRHLNAYWAKDGISAIIHIYSPDAATSDVLKKILARINISDIPLVYQLSIKGKAAFDRGEYTSALEFLRPALDSNNKNPELNQKEQRDLSLWTGISEAMCGNMQEAEIIFNAAIKRDPDYALFHYNLACVKAEQGKLPQAWHHLENALQKRTNLNPGQDFPDPLTDSSFLPFKDDKDFKALLQKYPLSKEEKPAAIQSAPEEKKIPPRKLAPLI